jgi:DNA-directed RNA polymerase specialized sigma24 family protein
VEAAHVESQSENRLVTRTSRRAGDAVVEQLFESFCRGNNSSLAELLERCQDEWLAIALQILGDRDRAEETLRLLLLKVVARRNAADPESSFERWVEQALRDACSVWGKERT